MATRVADGAGKVDTTAVRRAANGVRMVRPDDLLVLDVVWDGGLTRDGAALVAGAGGGHLSFRFPYQHTAEIATAIADALPQVPVEARAANRSRLVLRVPAGSSIPFTSAGLLHALATLEPAVAATAVGVPVRERAPGRPGRFDLPARQPFRIDVDRTPFARLLDAATAVGLDRAEVGAVIGSVSAAIVETQRALLAVNRAVAGGIFGGIGRVFDLPPVTVGPALPSKPGALETAIEAPFRLILSPSSAGRWAHAVDPVGTKPAPGPRRVELWHTRFAVLDVNGVVTEAADPQRIVRAIWTRDRDHKNWKSKGALESGLALDPFEPMLPINEHRARLVGQTAGAPGVPTRPVQVRSLALSALGAWLDLHVAFPDVSHYPDGFHPLTAWKQVSPQGRDAHVEVTVPGFLYPLGTPAYLTTMTWREITAGANGANPRAGLRRKQFLTLGQPETAYSNRDLPFTMARVGPHRTPDLIPQPNDTDPFVPSLPGTGPLLWKVDAQDHDGETIHLRTPMVWVRANLDDPMVVKQAADGEIASLPAEFHDGELLTIEAHGQTVAFAPALAADQQLRGDRGARATVEARKLRLQGDMAVSGSTPRLHSAEVVVPAIKRLSPGAEVVQVSYPLAYRQHGFDAGNVGNVFLELATPTTLGFGSSEHSGGFIQPDVIVGGLSRAHGLVADAAAAAAGTFDPKKLLAGAFPKLFGLFDLFKLVKDAAAKVGLDAAPKFVTEQLDRVSALLHDAETLQTLAKQMPSELKAAATQAKGVHASVMAWLGAVTNPDLATDAKTALGLLRTEVGTVAAALPGMVLSPFQRSELERVISALNSALATLDTAAGLFDELTWFVSGLASGGGEVRTRLEWKPRVNDLQFAGATVVRFTNPDTALKLSVEARASTALAAGLDVAAELTDFQLVLVPGLELMGLDFTRLAFRGGTSRRPEIDLVFGGISFLGILSFVETLKELIPLDGFSDPPFLDVSAEGVSAGFTVALPNVAIGVFTLSNLALGADARVPFLGESVSVGFNFCSRERPFTLGVFPLGGGGFFSIRLNPTGVVLLEASLEFGAVVALDFGVASGSVSAMGGIYFRLEGSAGSLAGFFRVRGEVDVLSLISASIELYMALTYAFETGKMIGEASITVSVEVFLFSTSVSINTSRTFAGSNGDPTARDMLFDQNTGKIEPSWNEYWAAFAPNVAVGA